MPERSAKVVELGPFAVFGGQEPGQKVRDLVEGAELMKRVGMHVHGCPVLAAEQFDRFLKLAGYTLGTPEQTVLGTPALPELCSILAGYSA